MIETSCHCGAVRLSLVRRPDYIHECNCSLCAKSGARWAYPAPDEVTVTGPTATYRRADKADPSALIHFCPRCASVTHFTLTESAIARFGNGLLGVNLRLADQDALAGIELRYPDGRGWSGEGQFGYVRPAVLVGQGDSG